MAGKRMFAKQIIDSDAFLEMPLSAQALYFHLSMRADDDGFVDNPRKIQRMVNASGDDLKLLMAKRYILTFESGVVVIKHWLIHNTLRTDRYKETVYLEEKALLEVKKNKSYTEKKGLNEIGIPNGNQMATQYSIDKNSIDKVSKDIYSDIVEYLNQKAGTRYKYSSKATQRHINGRLAEGHSLEDFKLVIDKKVNEWKDDPKMAQYLRPETLFGTKFEGYLNQKEVKGNPQSTQKVNAKIHNYPERTYTKEDYSDIEKKLLRRTIDADKD